MARDGDSGSNNRPVIKPWQKIHANERYSIFRIEVDFGDFSKVYFPATLGRRVGIVVPWQGGVVLVRQWRLLIEGFSLELPGGKIDEGETPEGTAARECLEETGLCCSRLEPLVHYLPGMDNLHNHTHVFLAQAVTDSGTFSVERGEIVERLCIPLEDCLARIKRGEIVCGMTIMGLLAYACRHKARA